MGIGGGPAVTAPWAVISRARSATVRWEMTLLTRTPAMLRWITCGSAQNRTVNPALAGPSHNCRPDTHMFPDGGTTRSNSIAPPDHSAAAAAVATINGDRRSPWSSAAAVSAAVSAAGARAGGSHSGSSRCSAGTGANRSDGVTGHFGSNAWCGRSQL